MVSVRVETNQDHAVVHARVAAAFGRANEAVLVDRLRDTDAFIPELSLVADADGTVVGHVLFTTIRIRNASDAVSGLALAPLAVRPDMQNAGIGSLLVRKGLSACRRLRHRVVIVVGHARYYPRFGF